MNFVKRDLKIILAIIENIVQETRMADKQKIATTTVGIIGLLSLIISGAIYFGDTSELDDLYLCLATDVVSRFTGTDNHPKPLSSTGLTGYYSDSDGDHIERCYASNGDKSSWIKLTDYLEDADINSSEFLKPKKLLEPKVISQNIGKKYLCSVDNCTEIK